MQFVARKVEAKNKRSRNAMRSFRRHAQIPIRSGRIHLGNGANSVCRNGKAKREDAYKPKSLYWNGQLVWTSVAGIMSTR